MRSRSARTRGTPVVQSDTLKGVKVVLIAIAALVALAALAYRPATLIGVRGDALAHSVGGGDLLDLSKCVKSADDRWRCEISKGSTGATYSVQTRAFGCWDATQVGPGAGHTPTERSGCINGLDVLSPF
jgi:hypothetical protein